MLQADSNHSKTQKQHITFTTNYLKEAVWADGLRDFFEYRDLGVAGATSGKVKAHILRVRVGGDPSELHTTGLHVHKLDFQMIYIRKSPDRPDRPSNKFEMPMPADKDTDAMVTFATLQRLMYRIDQRERPCLT